MKKRILSLMLAAVLALAAFIPAALAEETGSANEYYVFTDNTGKQLNVRAEPNGEVVGSLEQGTKVEIVSFVNENWAMINFTYDKAGFGVGEWPAYVSRRYLIDVDPAELAKAIDTELENYTGDPLTDVLMEIASAVDVENYKITVRPARVTSWVSMRWFPSQVGPVLKTYKATEELIVLKEMDHYLQVQDPDTGDVGYIHKMFAAKLP